MKLPLLLALAVCMLGVALMMTSTAKEPDLSTVDIIIGAFDAGRRCGNTEAIQVVDCDILRSHLIKEAMGK